MSVDRYVIFVVLVIYKKTRMESNEEPDRITSVDLHVFMHVVLTQLSAVEMF